MRPFQQCITVTAVNSFYEVLPKQFEAFGFYFSQGKKQVTAEYWVSLGSKGFCRQNAIFRSSKSANFVKNFATNPKFCHCTMHYFSLVIKFRQISSKINIFVTTAIFRHFVRVFRQKEILWSLTNSTGKEDEAIKRWMI